MGKNTFGFLFQQPDSTWLYYIKGFWAPLDWWEVTSAECSRWIEGETISLEEALKYDYINLAQFEAAKANN